MWKSCKRPSLQSSQPNGIRRPSRKPKLWPNTELQFMAECVRYSVLLFYLGKDPTPAVSIERWQDHSIEAFLSIWIPSGIPRPNEAGIVLFNRSHPLLQSSSSKSLFWPIFYRCQSETVTRTGIPPKEI